VAEREEVQGSRGFIVLSAVADLTGMSMVIFNRMLGWERIELEVFVAEVNNSGRGRMFMLIGLCKPVPPTSLHF